MREICYLTFYPIVLLNVFQQFESNLIYGLPSNRINQAPISCLLSVDMHWNKLHHSLQTSTVTVLFTFCQQLLADSNYLHLDRTAKAQPNHALCCLHQWLSVLARMVYGLSLKCFSWETLRSDFTHQGFLSIWNSFTVFCVKNGCLMWDGRPQCWGKHVFKLIPITKHGVWVIHILYPLTLCLWPLCAPLSLGC